MKSIKTVDEWGNIRYNNEKGQYHRTDGPAVEGHNGTKAWWLNGMEHTEQEFNNFFLKKRLQRIMEL
jgi:hypothetical protein